MAREVSRCLPKLLSALKSGLRLRRVRLVVRTQPSQGWCTGSTPVRAAISCPILRKRRGLRAAQRRMVNHAAAAKRYLIGDNFAVNGRAAAQAGGALVSHQNTVKDRLTGHRHVAAAVYDIEQDAVPGYATGQNDFG